MEPSGPGTLNWQVLNRQVAGLASAELATPTAQPLNWQVLSWQALSWQALKWQDAELASFSRFRVFNTTTQHFNTTRTQNYHFSVQPATSDTLSWQVASSVL